jgi:UDP-glucose 4-epimerase
MSKITGNENIQYLEARHEVKNAFSTYKKSIDLLDFKDTTTLSQGLEAMWNWAREQPEKEQKRWSQYEINKQIYLFWK